MKKIRGDKPVGVTIYLYMEISQGKSLCIHLYLKQAKCHVLLFLLQNWRTGGPNRSYLGGGIGTSGRGKMAGKGDRKVNAVQKMCIQPATE
jgi:hypothetical protein